MLFQRFVGAVSVVACIVLQSQIADAQAGGKRPMQRVRVAGKVHAVGPRGLQVVADNGTPWMVTPPDKLEGINFTGKASLDWLQRGMFVRFSAPLNQELEAQEPVSELAVITIRPGLEPGVFPEAGAIGGEEEQGEPQKRKRGSRRKTQDMIVPCVVIGQLYSLKDRQITVATVRRMMAKVELAADLTIDVQMNDFRFASPGDKIEVSGLVFPERPGQMKAQTISITAAKPLGTGKLEGEPEKEKEKEKGKEKGKENVKKADKRDK
jgi:hypothetical protein